MNRKFKVNFFLNIYNLFEEIHEMGYNSQQKKKKKPTD